MPVTYGLKGKVLKRRISLIIKSLLNLGSFPLFLCLNV